MPNTEHTQQGATGEGAPRLTDLDHTIALLAARTIDLAIMAIDRGQTTAAKRALRELAANLRGAQ